jgi:hypothetical protein
MNSGARLRMKLHTSTKERNPMTNACVIEKRKIGGGGNSVRSESRETTRMNDWMNRIFTFGNLTNRGLDPG